MQQISEDRNVRTPLGGTGSFSRKNQSDTAACCLSSLHIANVIANHPSFTGACVHLPQSEFN
jgi:hypothetical protein